MQILAFWEAEAGGLKIQAQPGQFSGLARCLKKFKKLIKTQNTKTYLSVYLPAHLPVYFIAEAMSSVPRTA